MHRDGDEAENVANVPGRQVLLDRARRAGLRDVSWPAMNVATVDQLERVFLERMDHLYRFLRSRTRDAVVAEDLTQQVFVKALLGHPSFRGDDDALVSWLFRIARNESATWLRRGTREVSWEILADTGFDPVDPGESPESTALTGERRRELAAVLATLSPEQRELISLRFAAGLSLVQIAGLLGLSETAVRQRFHRAMKHLRGVIDDPTALR